MERELTLPVTGMTCANCAATVERTLKKIDGVADASVSYASERARVRFDPGEVREDALVARVEDAGYGIATQTVELPITGMTCANCAATIERTLQSRVPGVVSASVNYATEKAVVEIVAGAVGVEELASAVEDAGYGVVQAPDEELEDAEAAARAAEIRDQSRKFWTGVVFALPLFVLSMSRDFGLLGEWAHAPWVNWLMFALATPVQFYVGWDYYVGGWKALKNGRPTWTSSWPWAPAWPTPTRWWWPPPSPWGSPGWASTSTSRPPPSSSPSSSWASCWR